MCRAIDADAWKMNYAADIDGNHSTTVYECMLDDTNNCTQSHDAAIAVATTTTTTTTTTMYPISPRQHPITYPSTPQPPTNLLILPTNHVLIPLLSRRPNLPARLPLPCKMRFNRLPRLRLVMQRRALNPRMHLSVHEHSPLHVPLDVDGELLVFEHDLFVEVVDEGEEFRGRIGVAEDLVVHRCAVGGVGEEALEHYVVGSAGCCVSLAFAVSLCE